MCSILPQVLQIARIIMQKVSALTNGKLPYMVSNGMTYHNILNLCHWHSNRRLFFRQSGNGLHNSIGKGNAMYRIDYTITTGTTNKRRDFVVTDCDSLRLAQAMARAILDWVTVYDRKPSPSGALRYLGQFDKRGSWFPAN